jgi:N-dimethylarginine dimethylaminohydrolase
MITNLQQNNKPSCFSEYDQLIQVIVCQPHYMEIRDVINETQRHFKDEGIHIERAVEQHDVLVKTLRNNGIEVILLPYHKKYPEQVFTRDIGFTLGQTIFVAQMASDVRKGEEDVLKQWLEDEEISYFHLDCVFNIISPELALIFPGALNQENIELLSSRYELIEVSEEEQFTLGTNVLGIGKKKILSVPVNKKVNQQLRERGFEVIEVDITEIIKSGGSFRCCTLPIIRAENSTM